MPTEYACRDGAKQAQNCCWIPMRRCRAPWRWCSGGPTTSSPTAGPIGQALALMGARPRFDSFGRLAGADLIPLEELGRPRIDVMMTLSGIFRDLLPLQTRLLAEAALQGRAWPTNRWTMNFVRAHALAHMPRRPAATIERRPCASSRTPKAPMARTSTSWSIVPPSATRTTWPTPMRRARALPMV
jgi:magnesium chelatase subunit H